MINMYEVSETNEMIEHENLDVRTITLHFPKMFLTQLPVIFSSVQSTDTLTSRSI